MRRWFVAAAVVLVVLVAVVAVALFQLNGWLARNREWIAAEVSRALGRQVTFDAVGVTFGAGVAARIDDLRVADDPAYSSEPFLRARSVRVAVRLVPALFGRIDVRYVVLDAPEVTVIRDRRGTNVATLGGGGAPATREAPPAAREPEPGPRALAPALLVASLRVQDGRLRYVDRTAAPPAEYTVEQLDVRVADVSPTTPVRLDVAAAVLGATGQNVKLDGKVGPLGDGPIPVDVTLRLDEVPPAALSGTIALDGTVAPATGGVPAVQGTATLRDVSAAPAGAPRVTGVTSTVRLRGDSAVIEPTRFALNGVPVEAEATVERFQPARVRYAFRAAALDLGKLGFGGAGVRGEEVLRDVETTGTAEVRDAGPVVTAAVRSPRGTVRDVAYDALAVDVGLAGQVATLDRLHVGAFGGTCDGSGRVDLHDRDRPRFAARSTIHGMTMRDLLAFAFPAAVGHFEGRLEGNLELAGAGADAEQVKRTVEGRGRIDVRDGVLKDVNLAESVLGGVTGIPGLVSLVPPDIRGRYPEVFGTSDTRFEALGGNVRIGDQRLVTDDARLAARDYAVEGRGGVGFDGRVDFTAVLIASEKLTADVVGRAKEARYVTNEQGRLAVPFRLVGKVPGVKPVPDPEWLARTLARAAAGKGVDQLLDRVAPKKGKKERPEQKLLRKGLEGLFGR
jgi:hypothetical protein